MIRFGMALMEMIEQLTKGFVKATGRQPDNLEKLKIQQEAVQRFKDMNKVVDMEGNVIDTSKGIMGGKQIQDSPEFGKKIKETYDAAKGPGKGQEMVDALKSPGARKSYEIIEDQLGVKLYGDESFEEILEIQKTGKHPRGEPKAEGGRIGLFAGSVPKILKLLKNPKKVKQAIDNIFPTGDVKYDATMAAESLVELNPKIFGNKLYDDLDSITRLDIYDAVISPMMSAQAKALRMKKATKPEKTLQSMKEGKGINMSDPEIAKEFEQFMKQTDPEGVKKLEQTLELDNFDPKGRKKNATGGRAGFANGTGAPSIKYDFDKEQEPMGPEFETNDPEEALKEIVKRMINVEPAKVPLSKDMMLMFDLDRAKIGGSKDIGGGILSFGINKGFGRDDTGMGFEFRKQFKDGSGMTRRTFLKLLGGMAAIPIVGKFLKPLKTAKGVKKVPMIATDNVPGKPEWFDQLVNKVILEGDDVTKKFATGERQSIHQKTLDDGSVVRVTEDVDDGAVRVEYESEANVFGDDVLMQYKKPLPDEGDPRPAAEFTTAESGPVSRQTGPDDFDLDVDEVGGSSIRDLDSDVSKLKEYATGKKPTMKELVQNIERRKKAQRITTDPEAQSDAVIARQGDYVPEYDDYASGGIARMLGE